jgi:hypothetical protein
MITIGRKLSILAFMAVATTALTLGTSTTFAISNSHIHHDIQLMSGDSFPTFAASNTHTHHHHMQLMSSGANSTNTNGVNSIGRGHDDIPTGWAGIFNPAVQYGFTGSHPHHHSSTHMIAHINGAAGSADSGNFTPTQYGFTGSHPHHHHSSTDMIADINGPNSASTNGFGSGTLPP